MAQKPVDKRSKYNTREYLWEVMLGLKNFCARDLVLETRYHMSTIDSYLTGLTAAGHITVKKDAGPASRWIYTIDPETAPLEPPRVRQDGTAVTQGQGRKNIWRTMKILKEFSSAEVAAFASTPTVTVAEGEVATYLTWMVKAGFISVLEPGKTTGGRTRYRFNFDRYTGPKPPQIQRIDQVYDPNTGKVVWDSKGGTP